MSIQKYMICIQPYYDSTHQAYKNILTIDRKPIDGDPLNTIVRALSYPRLSSFIQDKYKQKCVFAIYDPECLYSLMDIDKIALLYTFLANIGYTIDEHKTVFHKINNKMLCFITKGLNN
jgi:hypothetical protein